MTRRAPTLDALTAIAMKSRRLLIAIAGTAAVSAAALGIIATRLRPVPAPAIHYTRLDGQRGELEALHGHVVLVNFWATDCAPCVAEMPQLASMWRRLSPLGFETLAVAMADDPPFAVVEFTRVRQLPFTVAIDHDGAIAQGFGGVPYTPTSVLIDRQGQVVARWIGPTDFDDLERQVRRLLRT